MAFSLFSFLVFIHTIVHSQIETPADTIYPTIFALIAYFTIGLNPSFVSLLLFTIILVLNVLTAQSVGLFISAIVMDVRQAQVLGSVWILTSMLISGYYIDPDNVPSFVLPFRVLSFIKVCFAVMSPQLSIGCVLLGHTTQPVRID